MKGSIHFLSFNKKNTPIPADYRPLYKIGHIIMILATGCRGNKSSLMKLHFLAWAIKNKTNIQTVQEWINHDFKSDFHIWGVEPTVNRALLFAAADGFIVNSGNEYILTDRGMTLFKLIKDNKELFTIEKAFLEKIGKNGVTEQKN
jgi:hypothetical protein